MSLPPWRANGSAQRAADDRLREAIQIVERIKSIPSSLALLAINDE
jgi:hypothetical protein